ncbi:hypothetical protein KC867_02735 [Candidatus Saccharibacteria bacterium]|nr:hypothetical protein [Candidatus Saccharibacteria bacterium]
MELNRDIIQQPSQPIENIFLGKEIGEYESSIWLDAEPLEKAVDLRDGIKGDLLAVVGLGAEQVGLFKTMSAEDNQAEGEFVLIRVKRTADAEGNTFTEPLSRETDGSLMGNVLPTDGSEFTLGRGQGIGNVEGIFDSDDRTVSSKHMTMSVRDGVLSVVDGVSTNGSWVYKRQSPAEVVEHSNYEYDDVTVDYEYPDTEGQEDDKDNEDNEVTRNRAEILGTIATSSEVSVEPVEVGEQSLFDSLPTELKEQWGITPDTDLNEFAKKLARQTEDLQKTLTVLEDFTKNTKGNLLRQLRYTSDSGRVHLSGQTHEKTMEFLEGPAMKSILRLDSQLLPKGIAGRLGYLMQKAKVTKQSYNDLTTRFNPRQGQTFVDMNQERGVRQFFGTVDAIGEELSRVAVSSNEMLRRLGRGEVSLSESEPNKAENYRNEQVAKWANKLKG